MAAPAAGNPASSLSQHLMALLTDPTVAYLLLIAGIYGLFFEMVYPGFIIPGTLGALSLVLALYGLQYLSISYTGLALIICGILFVIAEGFVASFGLLGMSGTIAFVAGSMLLINPNEAKLDIAWSVIWSIALFNAFYFILLGHLALKAKNTRIRNGLELLIGKQGRALGEINPEGQAIIQGEIWAVKSKLPITANAKIKVLGVDGLLLDIAEESQGD